MIAENQTSSSPVEAVPKLVHLLQSLSSEDRHKAVSAAMILLGDSPVYGGNTAPGKQGGLIQPDSEISGKAQSWMAKNGITRDHLDHVFSIDQGAVEVIASHLPGSSKKQQTVQAYVLCGLKSFLLTGDMAFIDKDARDVCQKVGCYDSANHATYMKAFSNLIGGSKEIGWKITNPGLSEAAKIVRTLAPNGNA